MTVGFVLACSSTQNRLVGSSLILARQIPFPLLSSFLPSTHPLPLFLPFLMLPGPSIRRQLYVLLARDFWIFYNMSNYGRHAFCFAGPYICNSLPEHIRQSTSIAGLKRSLKTFLPQQISHLSASETIIFYCFWWILGALTYYFSSVFAELTNRPMFYKQIQ